MGKNLLWELKKGQLDTYFYYLNTRTLEKQVEKQKPAEARMFIFFETISSEYLDHFFSQANTTRLLFGSKI